MQIVIDVDDESYEHIKSYKNEDVLPMGWYAISHGTPLTKVDCISRQAVFDQLNQAYNLIDAEHKIKELKPVTLQVESDVPEINVGNRNCILDKIRTEIESCREDEEPHLVDYRYYRNEGLDMALDIIDKYKAESEE